MAAPFLLPKFTNSELGSQQFANCQEPGCSMIKES